MTQVSEPSTNYHWALCDFWNLGICMNCLITSHHLGKGWGLGLLETRVLLRTATVALAWHQGLSSTHVFSQYYLAKEEDVPDVHTQKVADAGCQTPDSQSIIPRILALGGVPWKGFRVQASSGRGLSSTTSCRPLSRSAKESSLEATIRTPFTRLALAFAKLTWPQNPFVHEMTINIPQNKYSRGLTTHYLWEPSLSPSLEVKRYTTQSPGVWCQPPNEAKL